MKTKASKSPHKEKHPVGWIKYLFQNIVHSAFIGVVWLILGWMWSVGIHWAVLIPINYIAGVTLGLAEGTFWGGVVARTILLVFFNAFFTTFMNHRGKGKLKAAIAQSQQSLLQLIPYFSNLKDFSVRDKLALYPNLIGVGFGMLSCVFLTGNGERTNTFVMFVLFVKLAGEAIEHRGIIIAILNVFLSLFGKNRLSRKPIDGIVNGAALGSLMGAVYSLICNTNAFMGSVGVVCLMVGFVLYMRSKNNLLKEFALCEDV